MVGLVWEGWGTRWGESGTWWGSGGTAGGILGYFGAGFFKWGIWGTLSPFCLQHVNVYPWLQKKLWRL